MNLIWNTNYKSHYPYELGSTYLCIDDKRGDDFHVFASICKEHPKKWNRDKAEYDIDFTKIDWIVSVPDFDVSIICESQEQAQIEVKRLLYEYTNKLHRFSQDTIIPPL